MFADTWRGIVEYGIGGAGGIGGIGVILFSETDLSD